LLGDLRFGYSGLPAGGYVTGQKLLVTAIWKKSGATLLSGDLRLVTKVIFAKLRNRRKLPVIAVQKKSAMAIDATRRERGRGRP
jgi:hypothetical protein